jgi:voltage-gated potassium channel
MATRTESSPVEIYRQTRQRVVAAMIVLVVVTMAGAFGYWYLGWLQYPGHWSFKACLYMVAITITTVGYGETLDLDSVAGAREWTMMLLVFGISANLYVVSAITSFFVEADFANVRRYRRKEKRMREISGHYIVCGVGRTGVHVVNELVAVGHSVVALDTDERALAEVAAEGDRVLTLRGDATEDEVLEQAGLSRAKGIVVTLDDDRTNMFVVVTARQASPTIRIVAKAVSASAVSKLRKAGANAVVSPNSIGGMRLASEMIRPEVVRFLDEMLRDKEANLRIEEAVVREGPWVGMSLRHAAIREETGVLVIAVRSADGTSTYVPSPELVIEAGQVLVGIGRPEQVRRMRESVGG